MPAFLIPLIVQVGVKVLELVFKSLEKKPPHVQAKVEAKLVNKQIMLREQIEGEDR